RDAPPMRAFIHSRLPCVSLSFSCFFFQAEDGIRDFHVTGVQTCALPIWLSYATQLFRLWQSSLDNFMLEQAHRHVFKHGLTVCAGTIEVTTTFTMTHGLIP